MAEGRPGVARYGRRPFPPYRHLPGTTPHPTRDPAGHSFGREPAPVGIDESSWSGNDAYLDAIDLFNAGYYWECHEALEPFWHGADRDGDVRRFLQGLIQAAAALLKATTGKAESARRLARAGARKLRAGAPVVLGVEAYDLANAVTDYVDAGAGASLPVIVLRLPASRSG
jgi:hypothetical protein